MKRQLAPSAVHYNTYSIVDGAQKYSDGTAFTGVASGSSNYGPSDPVLVQRVQADMDRFLADNPDVAREDIPTDLMTASGSGLDPHISPRSAAIQIPAISAASGLSTQMLEADRGKQHHRKTLWSFRGRDGKCSRCECGYCQGDGTDLLRGDLDF